MTDDRVMLKGFLKEHATQTLEKSKNGAYCCPACGSGHGPNGSGALTISKQDPTHWHCFSCNQGGDLIDLIGIQHDVDTAHAFQIARELYGGAGQSAAAREYSAPIQPRTEARADFRAYLESCREELQHNEVAKAYLRSRGLSETTISRARMGYDPEKKAIVMPYNRSGSYYTTRTIEGKAYRKPKTEDAGQQPLYNQAELWTGYPVFIVEGELDALSVNDAGGHAVGLAGTAGKNLLLQTIEDRAPAAPLFLALDNDEAGRKATADIVTGLERLGIPFAIVNIAGKFKDANERLQADRAGLEAAIREAMAYAAELADRQTQAEREAYQKKNRVLDFIEQFTGDIVQSAANTAYIPTGYAALDEVLDGGLYPGLYVLGAISSLGKTTLVLQAADQIAAGGHDVLIFSLEMARSELMSKSISRETLQISLARAGDTRLAKTARGITTGKRWQNYSQTEVETIKAAISQYAEYAKNVYIQEGYGDIGYKEIREAVETHTRLTGAAPVVVVDYLQLLTAHDPRSSDKQNTDKAVLELKRISRDFRTPVIAISSLNRNSYGEAINMAAFKESGAIEYGSDVLIGLQAKGAGTAGFDVDEAKAKDPREIEFKILKNRNGQTGKTLNFEYYPMFNFFRETAEQVADQTYKKRR